jgi:integrase
MSIRPSTLRSYDAHVERHLVPHLGRVRLGALTGRHVAAMFASLASTPNSWSRLPQPSTLHRIRATLRSALNAAVRDGRIRDNPARFVELPTPRRQQAQVWTDNRVEEWRRTGRKFPVAVWTERPIAEFLELVGQDRLYAMWWLIALRGLRRGEAAGLRWVDVDLDAKVVMITQPRITYGHTTTVGPPKMAASRRTIALDKVTVRVLREYRRRQATQRVVAGEAWEDSGYVFADRVGAPLNPDYLTRRFRALVSASGLPPVRLHDLRHGAATLAHAAGADLKTVQEQLGHSIVLTADPYTSVLAAAARNPGRKYRGGPLGTQEKSAAPQHPTRPEPVRPKRSKRRRQVRRYGAHRTHLGPTKIKAA